MKLLFLPHCLKKEYLKELKKEGQKRNYETFVVGGGSVVKKLLDKYSKSGSIEKIVGVACKDEIKLAMEYTKYLRGKKVKVVAIPLLKDGCKNTEVSLERVIKSLK